MIIVITCLVITIGVFGVICLRLSAKIDDERIKRELQKMTIDYLVKRVNLNQECIELQTKCVKDLNSIVKKSVESKELTKPDTKALVSGWDADEVEPEDLVKNHIVDICLNGTYEQKQDLIDVMTLQRALLGQAQQYIYPWQPLQIGRFQSCSMLPLWYINRRLEDM